MSEKILVIAEKPSVAQDIVKALTPIAGKFEKKENYFESEQYIVTSAVGHLVEIKAPEEYDVKRGKWSFANLPVIPPSFDLEPVAKTKARLTAVVKLVKRKDVTLLVNACDAGREGELIFRLIIQYAKSKLPIKRLWLSSMTSQAIRDGFTNLRTDQDMLPLADAARSRSEADWLVGINGTRAMTAFNSRDGGFFLTTVGRVQTPTLAVVIEREEKIRKFVSRDYWEVYADFNAKAGTYTGKWFDPEWKKSEDDTHAKADRIWDKAKAQTIAEAIKGQQGIATEESKPSSQLSPLLFDLTSLQREANSRFGFSAKTTLSIAQALYEKHKALTYPRTDSRALPEDYVSEVQLSMQALASSSLPHLAPFAQQALANHYIKPTKRVFDNKKVSDHFAIIPTQQVAKGLSEVEQKIYDLVVRRFIAVFFPAAKYQLTTRITKIKEHAFKSEGKVLIEAGWLSIYGKDTPSDDVGEGGKSLVAIEPKEQVLTAEVGIKEEKTKPPARYTEASLLTAMEGAGKTIEDEELRAAMQEKGLGTPATRASIIEGLIHEKYLIRDARELIPTAKAFQLLTLLRGLEVDELSKPKLTGEWENKLAQIEKGLLSREQFMSEIAQMTNRIVSKAKEYNSDSIPGDYATLKTPCPHCGGIIKENYRRFSCTGKNGKDAGCGFSISKIPGGRSLEIVEAEQLIRDKHIGPLEGFRSKAGWPFVAELKLVEDEEIQNWKLEFDFGEKKQEESELVDLSTAKPLGNCPQCGAQVFDTQGQYVCEKAVTTDETPKPSCKFKVGKIILQQTIDTQQIEKLLTTGKTDLLENFVSNRTKRKFKAYLTWDKSTEKMAFEFEPRAKKTAAKKSTARKTTAKKLASSQ